VNDVVQRIVLSHLQGTKPQLVCAWQVLWFIC